MSDNIGGVCLVTQPERSQTGKEHAADLADVIAELTTVLVLTANLPENSRLERDHETVEYSQSGSGQRLPVEILRFIQNQFRLCIAVRKLDESVVLFFGTTAYFLPVIVARVSGKRVLVLPRGDVPLSLQLRWEERMPASIAGLFAAVVRLLEHISYRSATGIVTYSPAMAEQLGLGRYSEKLHTNGARFIDTSHFDVRIPLDEREPIVGFVGRFDVEKRVPTLAKAVKHLPDDIGFIFVGDGEYRQQLESILETERNHGQVEIVGWVDREAIPEQLNRMQLLVTPSHPTEGLPTVILEAMACGTPAYATPVAGVPDVVRDGETGFTLEIVDERAIAADIERIVSEENLSEVSHAARELIETTYSFDAAVERYSTILQEVTHGRPR